MDNSLKAENTGKLIKNTEKLIKKCKWIFREYLLFNYALNICPHLHDLCFPTDEERQAESVEEFYYQASLTSSNDVTVVEILDNLMVS